MWRYFTRTPVEFPHIHTITTMTPSLGVCVWVGGGAYMHHIRPAGLVVVETEGDVVLHSVVDDPWLLGHVCDGSTQCHAPL